MAGIVINLSVGENGLFNKAKTAKEKYEIAGIREKIEIEILNIELEEDNLGNEVTIELVLQKLLDNKTFETIDKGGKIGYIDSYEVKLKYNESNKVVIEYVKEATGVKVTYSLEPSTYTKEERVDILLKVQGKVKSITSPDGLVVYPKQDTIGVDYSVTSNGSYTFIIENEDGKKEEKNVIVDIIDRLPPKAFEISAQTTRTGGIKVTANAEDEEADENNVKSGIGRYEYYVKLTTASEYTKYDTNEIISLPSGTYKVYAVAYDKAENSIRSTNEVEVVVEEWVQIWNEEDLRNMANNLSKNYIIMQDIELTQPWTTIGNSSNRFIGKLEGDNHKITGLVINSEEDYQGIFASMKTGGKVRNLNVECNVHGKSYVGAIVGINYGGTIENVKIRGLVDGYGYIGGIVGSNSSGIITKSISDSNIRGGDNCIGGLVGSNSGTITYSHSTGDIIAWNNVGGLVGSNSGVIENSYSTSKVMYSGNRSGSVGGAIGGLIGRVSTGGSVTNVYSTGDVTGIAQNGTVSSNTGGLIGLIQFSPTISNAYSTGNVSGSYYVGGLIGGISDNPVITNTYSTGTATGKQYIGGLVGQVNRATITNAYTISKVIGDKDIGGFIGSKKQSTYKPTINNSYWSKENSGVDTSLYGTCLTLENMKKQSSYQNWDFSSGTVWRMGEYPELILNINIEE